MINRSSHSSSLKCYSVVYAYRDRPVLKDISFEIKRGVFCAVLGRNGSGKTTLIRCLGGLLKPDSGRIEVDGINVGQFSRKEVARHISHVPQEHTEIFPFRVIDMVVMGRTPFLGFAKRPGSDDYEMAIKALEVVNGTRLAYRNFNRISGGEKQIAFLARAILQSVETMLLDEPTNHLDFNTQYLLLNRMKYLCRQKDSRIVASMHDPNMAMLFADYVILLKKGRVLAMGLTADVMNVKNISELYETEACQIKLSCGGCFFRPMTENHEEGTWELTG